MLQSCLQVVAAAQLFYSKPVASWEHFLSVVVSTCKHTYKFILELKSHCYIPGLSLNKTSTVIG